MGTGTQSAINSTEALLEVKRQTKEALLKKEQLMIEHKKALARVEAMQMLQGLQIKARELARTLKQEEPKKRIHCPICLESRTRTKSIKLSACKHKLCIECARNLVLASIKSCSIPIMCPVCLAEPQACRRCMATTIISQQAPPPPARTAPSGPSSGSWLGSPLKKEPPTTPTPPVVPEVERTLLPADWCCSMDADVPKLLSVAERRDYSRKSLQAAVAKGSGLLPCPVPDCPGIAATGKEDANVTCNACMHSWCMGCEEPCHPNLTCEEYQAHQLRRENEAVAERGFTSYKVVNWVKRCSSCGHGLEKISGCDHVTCAGCKRAWNYSALQRAV